MSSELPDRPVLRPDPQVDLRRGQVADRADDAQVVLAPVAGRWASRFGASVTGRSSGRPRRTPSTERSDRRAGHREGLCYHSPSRQRAGSPARVVNLSTLVEHTERRSATLARTPRKWQGARNPSGLKRVRQAERRHAILQPRRSAAKTLVAKAVTVATIHDRQRRRRRRAERGHLGPRPRRESRRHPPERRRAPQEPPDAQGQRRLGRGRPSRRGHIAKSTGKAAAAKAAKARIAAGKAVKAKGAQTAAGKARAALSKTTRAEGTRRPRPPRPPPRPPPRSPGRQGRGQGEHREGDHDQGHGHQGRTTKATATKAPRRRRPRRRPSTTKSTTAKAAPKTTKAE